MKYLAITAVLVLILAGTSFAGNVTITEVLTGGNLTLTMPDNFSMSNVTIGGSSSQLSTGTSFTTIEDSRGTGVGWNLGIQISQFMTSGTPARTIDTNKYSMTFPQTSIDNIYGQAIDATNGPKTLIPNGQSQVITSTEVKAIQTLAGYGMGKYRTQGNHMLSIDADRYAGTYTATLTATLNNVP